LLEMTAPSVCASDLMYIRLGSRQILGHERRPPSRRHRRSTRWSRGQFRASRTRAREHGPSRIARVAPNGASGASR